MPGLTSPPGGSFSPGTNESGKPFSADTMFLPSDPPHCGQSAAHALDAESKVHVQPNVATHVAWRFEFRSIGAAIGVHVDLWLKSTPLVLGTPVNPPMDSPKRRRRAGAAALEDAFGNVMAVAAGVNEDVYVAQDVDSEDLQEVGHQLAVELANLGRGEFGFADEIGPAAEVDRTGRQRLVHRHVKWP